jgi:hypothetical protein
MGQRFIGIRVASCCLEPRPDSCGQHTVKEIHVSEGYGTEQAFSNLNGPHDAHSSYTLRQHAHI